MKKSAWLSWEWSAQQQVKEANLQLYGITLIYRKQSRKCKAMDNLDRSNSRTSSHCLTCLPNYKALYLSKRQYCICYRSNKTITRSRVTAMTLRFPQLFKIYIYIYIYIYIFLHLMWSQGSLPRICYELHYTRPRSSTLVFMAHFNITFFSVRLFYKWAFSLILPNQNLVRNALVAHMCYMTRP